MTRRRSLTFRLALVSLISNVIVSVLFFSYHLNRLRPDQIRCMDQLDWGYLPNLTPPSPPFRNLASYNATGRRLTDIVVPLLKTQLPRLKANMDTWITFPPCSLSSTNDGGGLLQPLKDLGRDVALTFALSDAPDPDFEEELLQHFADLPAEIRGCFGRVRVFFAALQGKQNSYILGSRNMFYYFLNNTIGLDNPHYALYMEPDMVPVRRNWLAALDASVRDPVAPFWLRGSLFRGNLRAVINGPLFIVLHINGNAIYNLADPAFQQFIFEMMHHTLQGGITQNAYDTDIFRYLVKEFGLVQEVSHKFQYTNMIQNHWHCNWTVQGINKESPLTYLVHGGRKQD